MVETLCRYKADLEIIFNMIDKDHSGMLRHHKVVTLPPREDGMDAQSLTGNGVSANESLGIL